MASTTENQEIDLTYLSKKVSTFFEWIGYSIFRFIKFLKNNILIILILVIIGAVVGYILDQRTPEKYTHQIVLVPNFNSTSYLYNKIENTKFTNSPITSVKIEPVIDMYEFITDEWINLEVAKYLSQNNIQINKYSPKSDVEKFYRYHLLTVTTIGEDVNGKIIDELINELNQEPYFQQRQRVEIENTKRFIAGLEKSVENIDQILESTGNLSQSSSNLNIEVYSELNNLVTSKRSTLVELNKRKVEQAEGSMVIYPASKILNIHSSSAPKAIILPLLLFASFLLGSGIVILFKKYQKIEKS